MGYLRDAASRVLQLLESLLWGVCWLVIGVTLCFGSMYLFVTLMFLAEDDSDPGPRPAIEWVEPRPVQPEGEP